MGWVAGGRQSASSKPPPPEQADNGNHAPAAKLTSLPDWHGRPTDLRAGHAVAFPDVGVRTTATRSVGLGPDTDLALVIDQADLASDELAHKAVDRAYDFWLGDRRRGSELLTQQLELIDELLGRDSGRPILHCVCSSRNA